MITNDKINQVNRKIREAIKSIEREENVKISFGTSRYDEVHYKSTMTVKTTAIDNKTVKAKGNQDQITSKLLGFSENIIGKTFKNGSNTFIVSEFKLRNRKYPIIATDTSGKGFKFEISTIKRVLNIK